MLLLLLGLSFNDAEVEPPVPSKRVREVVRVGIITISAEGFLLEPEGTEFDELVCVVNLESGMTVYVCGNGWEDVVFGINVDEGGDAEDDEDDDDKVVPEMFNPMTPDELGVEERVCG